MLTYILEVSCCWLLFYSIYRLWLRNETFFQLNRSYLLFTILLGLLVPMTEFPFFAEAEDSFSGYYLQPITIGMQAMEGTLEEIVVTPIGTGSTWNWSTLLLLIYGAGVLYFASRFIIGLLQILRLRENGIIEQRQGYQFIQTPGQHLPFSFFNMLFWSSGMITNTQESRQILRHELAHIQQKHSYDILFIEMLSILFWCSPLIHWFNKSMRDVHEYLADEAVLHTTAKKQYGRMLLQQSQSGLQIALAHHLIQSQLKKRILMITKNKSRRWALAKYSLILPALLVMLFVFSSSTNSNSPIDSFGLISTTISDNPDFDKEAIRKKLGSILVKYDNKTADKKAIIKQFEAALQETLKAHPAHQETIINIADELVTKVKVPCSIRKKAGSYHVISNMAVPSDYPEETYKVVEEMPRFIGCEEVTDASERQLCTQKKMLEFIYKNVKYPEAARKQGIEGMVVVRFIISKTGEVKSPEIIRELGGGCDESVLEVVSQMPNWIPGRQKGKAVNVFFNLPVKFKLSPEDKQKAKASTDHPDGKPYKVVEEMPRFPGCEDKGMAGEELKRCSNKALINFLIENIKYPESAKATSTEGTVVVSFVVDEQGKLIKPKIVRSLSDECDAEVLRLVDLMNQMPEAWTPGRQKGEIVPVSFNLPIRFALPKESGAAAKPRNALQMHQFAAFPNPASDVINLSLQAAKGSLLVSFTDASGKEVFAKEWNSYDGSHLEEVISVKQAARGALFIKVYNKELDQAFTKSVILQ